MFNFIKFFIVICLFSYTNIISADNTNKDFTYLICKPKLLIPVSDSDRYNVFIKFFYRVNDSSIEEYPNSFHYISDERLKSGPGIQVELLEAAPHDNKSIYEFMPGLFFAVKYDDEYSHGNKFSLDRKTLNLTYSEKVPDNIRNYEVFRFYEGSEKKCRTVPRKIYIKSLNRAKEKVLKFNKKNLNDLKI